MEQNDTHKPTTEQFAKYFAGECSVEERVQIDSWIGADPVNEEEAERLQMVWQDIGTLRNAQPEVDTASAFKKVKAKKQAQESTRKFQFGKVWKVAAAVVLVASVVIYLLTRAPEQINHLAESIDKIELPDGSQITINEGSELIYPEEFTGDKRQVKLVGEAFFEVSPNREKPFIIEVNGVTITVVGTSFNVKESYKNINVTVSTGVVEVKSDFGTEILKAGDEVNVNFGEKSVEKQLSSQSGVEQFWFSTKLAFNGVTMKEVIADLQEAYGVKIEVSSDKILNCKLQATFEGQSIDEVLEIIALSENLKVDKTNGNYLITGEGCND